MLHIYNACTKLCLANCKPLKSWRYTIYFIAMFIIIIFIYSGLLIERVSARRSHVGQFYKPSHLYYSSFYSDNHQPDATMEFAMLAMLFRPMFLARKKSPKIDTLFQTSTGTQTDIFFWSFFCSPHTFSRVWPDPKFIMKT